MKKTSGNVLFLDDVTERYKISRSTLYRLIRENGFPKPYRLPGSRLSRWNVSMLDTYDQQTKKGKL